MYIAIEGVDGAGKSTARKAIMKWFNHYFPARDIVKVREPGGTVEGEELRTLLLDRKDIDWNTLSELCLMTASRVQLIENVIAPALLEGNNVVGDRCYLSSEAYQAINPTLTEKFHVLHKGLLMPDIVVLVDLDPNVAEERTAGGYKDRIEERGVAFQHECRLRYLEAAKKSPFIITVDSSGTEKETHGAVFKALTEAFFECTPMGILVGNETVSYSGAAGVWTSVPKEEVKTRLRKLGYSALATTNHCYLAQHGTVALAEGLFNLDQALKVNMAHAIRNCYW